MILVNTKKFLTGFRSLKELYKNLVYIEIENQKQNNDIALNQFFKIYSEDELRQAIESIHYDARGFLVSPEHTKENIILRYLEFGGESANPTHVLSRASDALDKYFNMEDR